ncbi:MAG TPA: SHOCT domain-containing protein [Azospirillaceae bacterium]|nr:SHOCT domain-containing protein [Azospirillaceae bacterium]
MAPAATDHESGNEGDAADEAARSLRALKVMRDRGLLSDAEFETRRREILGSVERGKTA